jgi:hypothetical protein
MTLDIDGTLLLWSVYSRVVLQYCELCMEYNSTGTVW